MRPLFVVALVGVAACAKPDLRFWPGAGDAGQSGIGGNGGAGGGGGAGGSGGGGGSSDGGAPVSLDGFVAPPPDGGNCTVGQSGVLGLVPAATMAPGTACIACHTATNAGVLHIAGTVYNDYHEADLCLGVTDVKVQIQDAQGTVHMLDVNSSGNFVANSLTDNFPSPWSVAVVRGSLSRPMLSKVMSGDCNSCHTATGAQAAPGRIIAPVAGSP
jgi:hypothetical protein